MSAKLAIALGLLCLTGCHSAQPHLQPDSNFDSKDPAAIFSRIHQEFLRGQLDLAGKEAATEKTRLLQRDPTWSFRFCLLEAEVLQFQGRSQELVDVLAQQTHVFTPQGDLAIKQDLLLSLANARLGHQQLSTVELAEAHRLSDSTHSQLQAEVLRTQGLLENRNSQQDAAERSLRASLALARTQNDAYLEATDLLNLGRIALQNDHIDEAIDILNGCSLLADRIHADVVLQSAEGNVGWAYFALGDFNRSLASFHDAGAHAHALGATDGEILWLESSGLSLSHLGDLSAAQSTYERALQLAQSIHDTTRQAEIHTALASLFLQLDRLDPARQHADEALQRTHETGDAASALDASLVDALVSARTSSDQPTEQKLRRVLASTADAPSIRWEVEDTLASLYDQRHLSQQAEQWHRRSLRTFESQRDSVEDEERRLPFFSNGDDLYRHYAEFLIASHRSTEALYLLDSARARTLKEGLGSKPEAATSRGQVRPTSTRDSITLFYALGPHQSYLWAIDRSGPHLTLLPPAPLIASHIKSYQASILKSRDPIAENNADALWLYTNLIAPAASFLPPQAHVLVIPDGPLNGFNLETLLKPTPAGPHYWIDDVDLTTASSMQLTVQTHLATHDQPSGRLLLIGDPLAASTDYPTLPHAAEEIGKVEQYFPAPLRTTLTQTAAAPASYAASHPDQYAYLHFVAHGTASSLRPLDSAIVLSPPSNDTDRFKLYAREIVHQPLTARLVTISSCYGSGVSNYADEGLVGLSWAFLRAGAHQVIGALWEVDDSSTPQLMDRMYRELTAGAAPDQALRTAKLAMLHSQGVFRKPLYWAAFQLYSGGS